MRHAVIDKKTNMVVNVVMWDGNNKWNPPNGNYVIQSDIADAGDLYDLKKKTFTKSYLINK